MKLEGSRFGLDDNYFVEMCELKEQLQRVTEALSEAIAELKTYAQGRRDTSFEGWQKEWREIEVKHESDYEFYPNHVDRETIQRLEQALAHSEGIKK